MCYALYISRRSITSALFSRKDQLCPASVSPRKVTWKNCECFHKTGVGSLFDWNKFFPLILYYRFPVIMKTHKLCPIRPGPAFANSILSKKENKSKSHSGKVFKSKSNQMKIILAMCSITNPGLYPPAQFNLRLQCNWCNLIVAQFVFTIKGWRSFPKQSGRS